MELQEYDIVIRQVGTEKTPFNRLVIIGHEEEMTFEGETTMDCIRQMNWALYNRNYERRQRCDKQLNRLRDQLKKDSGIKPWQFWRKPSRELRDQMNDLVIAVCKEQPKLTYEEVADEVLRRWNKDN